jgi:hypothetical protein
MKKGNTRLRSFVGISAPILLTAVSVADVVTTIDVGGDVDVTNELGSFSLASMQDLIVSTNDLEIAGVLDAEGTFGAGNFSNESGALAGKISGASRFGREDGVASKASGSRWGFVNGSETWTPEPGLYHLGLITTPLNSGNVLTVTVTYSDTTTETAAATEPGVTTWIGFYKRGETITSISISDPAGGAFGNYDDLSLAFVEATAEEDPVVDISRTQEGELLLSFTGVLQRSEDLETWVNVDDAPESPYVLPVNGTSVYYRSRLAE